VWVLEQRSGRKLLDLARNDLLEPLGIKKWEWRTGAHSHPLAYAGLRLTPPDLLRIGRLVLSGGRWQGRQVPAAWVAEMLQPSNGGQRLYVVPELELVVVMTAGAYNSERIGAVEFALLRQIVAAV
jgi:CubicO group peptidase (beta-lactamase class C family)